MAKSSQNKSTSKRVKWSQEMDNMLIELWGEAISDLRGVRKNSHVYAEIAVKLKDFGFTGGWPDVRTKVDNLTRKYREEKKKVGPSGGAPSSWAYYDRIHIILGGLRVHDFDSPNLDNENFFEVINEVIEYDPESSTCSTSTIFSSESQPPAKRSKQDVHSELLEVAQERLRLQTAEFEARERHRERQRELQREHLKKQEEALKEIARSTAEYARSTAEFQKKILEKL